MYQNLLRDASFWQFPFSIDQDLAESARKEACPFGGRLHRANYPRKPRGGPGDLPDEHGYRLSFCCDRDGIDENNALEVARLLAYFRALQQRLDLSVVLVHHTRKNAAGGAADGPPLVNT